MVVAGYYAIILLLLLLVRIWMVSELGVAVGTWHQVAHQCPVGVTFSLSLTHSTALEYDREWCQPTTKTVDVLIRVKQFHIFPCLLHKRVLHII
jgi:hypothetical protein